jgi:hypothetical protein
MILYRIFIPNELRLTAKPKAEGHLANSHGQDRGFHGDEILDQYRLRTSLCPSISIRRISATSSARIPMASPHPSSVVARLSPSLCSCFSVRLYAAQSWIWVRALFMVESSAMSSRMFTSVDCVCQSKHGREVQ